MHTILEQLLLATTYTTVVFGAGFGMGYWWRREVEHDRRIAEAELETAQAEFKDTANIDLEEMRVQGTPEDLNSPSSPKQTPGNLLGADPATSDESGSNPS